MPPIIAEKAKRATALARRYTLTFQENAVAGLLEDERQSIVDQLNLLYIGDLFFASPSSSNGLAFYFPERPQLLHGRGPGIPQGVKFAATLIVEVRKDGSGKVTKDLVERNRMGHVIESEEIPVTYVDHPYIRLLPKRTAPAPAPAKTRWERLMAD